MRYFVNALGTVLYEIIALCWIVICGMGLLTLTILTASWYALCSILRPSKECEYDRRNTHKINCLTYGFIQKTKIVCRTMKTQRQYEALAMKEMFM